MVDEDIIARWIEKKAAFETRQEDAMAFGAYGVARLTSGDRGSWTIFIYTTGHLFFIL
jgi:hypothetical protein